MGMRVMRVEGVSGVEGGKAEAKSYSFHRRAGAYNGWGWWWCEADKVL